MNIDALKEIFAAASMSGCAGMIDVMDVDDESDAAEVSDSPYVMMPIDRKVVEAGDTALVKRCFKKMEKAGCRNGAFGGKIILTWSGYAADDRELWEIPEVTEFATALFFGKNRDKEASESTWILDLLVNEEHPDFISMIPDLQLRWETGSGRLFLVSLTRPACNKIWDKDEKGNICRDAGLNVHLLSWFLSSRN